MGIVDVSYEQRVATLTLNRPEQRNALSVSLCNEIVGALGEIEASDARALIVRGAGKVFCSGADFSAVSGPGGTDFLHVFERMLDAVAGHRLPTVAAIHGAALGGGLQLATVCDFRIVASDARLGIPSARLGVVVNFENVRRLVLLAGPAVAKEVLMAARTLSGRAAEDAGLVTETVAADDVESSAQRFAAHLASLSPLSVQGAKRSIAMVAAHLGDARRHDGAAVAELDRLVAEAYTSDDLQEGLRAAGERGAPEFRGR